MTGSKYRDLVLDCSGCKIYPVAHRTGDRTQNICHNIEREGLPHPPLDAHKQPHLITSPPLPRQQHLNPRTTLLVCAGSPKRFVTVKMPSVFALLLPLLLIGSTQGVNQCLDPDEPDHDRCTPGSASHQTTLNLYNCGMTEGDAGSLAECFDRFGADDIITLTLRFDDLTTLPEGILDSLGNLQWLSLSTTGLTTLPEGIFDSLGNLQELSLSNTGLTTLPEGIFDPLGDLQELALSYNGLTTLPEGIFNSLGNLQ
ncbi:unnamed protein product [Ectocarpus fasciculatus]